MDSVYVRMKASQKFILLPCFHCTTWHSVTPIDMSKIIQCGATCLFPQVTHIFLKPLLLTALKERISLIWRKVNGWTIMFCMLCQARSDNSPSGMFENLLVQYTAPSLRPTSGNNAVIHFFKTSNETISVSKNFG